MPMLRATFLEPATPTWTKIYPSRQRLAKVVIPCPTGKRLPGAWAIGASWLKRIRTMNRSRPNVSLCRAPS